MRYITIAILLLLSLLSACTQDKVNKDADAIIKEANLTEFEKYMVKIAGTNSFHYDMEIKSKDVNKLHTTIDYYENGNFKRKIADSYTALSEKDLNETIRTVFIRQQPTNNQEQWISTVMTKDGYSSSESKLVITKRKEAESSTWGGISDETPLHIGEKRIIASLINSDKNAVSITYNMETEEEIKKATNYEQVYLISVELQ
ncbi:hypothetical protein [Virgibacillus oceani]|uniref:DUF5067 domain-containing protein n=1 Tax=Virgibacillus oceani TaxID=1479511 RepID=A0A917M1V9_9BACI|nr:hypothetical protein [Virgibacillus oceani]GGG72367.1 hypothetical protein GCM10011398_15930 [Virgibacillus oceani]